jgi:fructokinase
MQKKKICCFGEMLWDVVSDGKHPGGAPLNVAYHSAKFGSDVSLASKVGDDVDGAELQRLVASWNIDTSLIQVDRKHSTGQVNATMLENGEVEYDIKGPVAWDYIEKTDKLENAVKASDCFIYGSLSIRSDRSRETLMGLLEEARFKVFDVNLRSPYYKPDTLDLLLGQADLLKLNNWELVEVTQLLGLKSSGLEEGVLVNMLMEKFSIREVVVTKGRDGAVFYSGGKVIRQASEVVVQVRDTIGCGDAFLAAFIVSYLQNELAEIMLKKAVAMGAFLATKSGGCPPYRLSEYEDFYDDNFLR